MKKVCVFTGTRAEYGLLRWVMEAIRNEGSMELQVVASGSHYSAMHGWTYKEIERDGFRIDRKVEMLLASDSPLAVNKSMALAQIGIAEALCDLGPDMLLVLGDRYEALAAALAAAILRVPIGHIHGGEITEGSLDDSFRHAITKLSHLHFVSTEEHRKNVIQLGENPSSVHIVGGLGVEAAIRCELIDKDGLRDRLQIAWKNQSMLVTFHPVTTINPESSLKQMQELLGALDTFPDSTIIITRPNADQGHGPLNKAIDQFVEGHKNAKAFPSLGSQIYLSCLATVDLVVGNSSSAILEGPVFRKPAVNVGSRQQGRLRAGNIIDCEPEANSIRKAILRATSSPFVESMQELENPFGDGNSSKMIANILKDYKLSSALAKQFHRINDKAKVIG